MFGALCASGWHTTAAWMQCFLKYWIAEIGRLKKEGLKPPNLGLLTRSCNGENVFAMI